MKLKLLYLLSITVIFASSCAKKQQPPPPSSLAGTFVGPFMLIHTPKNATKPDTLTRDILLEMQANSTYKVTGDTSTLHAGSHGFFSVGSTIIQFFDQTYPPSGNPAKIHLSGTYNYTYDGVVFRINGNDLADTVSYQYVLRKNN